MDCVLALKVQRFLCCHDKAKYLAVNYATGSSDGQQSVYTPDAVIVFQSR